MPCTPPEPGHPPTRPGAGGQPLTGLASELRPDPSLGVFETLLARAGRIQALGAHLQRLAASVSELYQVRLPASLAGDLRGHVAGVAGERRLRVDVAPGEAGSGEGDEGGSGEGGLRVVISSSAVDADRHRAISCRPVTVPGGLGPHKWADRRRLRELAGVGVTALIVDGDGQLLEAAWANVWLIEGERLITPAADGRLLPGVTRGLLLRDGHELGLDPREEPVSLHRARAAEAMFLTSSLRHAVHARLRDGPSHTALGPLVDRIRAVLGGLEWE